MINSRYNPLFKELKSLLEAKGARRAGKILVSGRKIVPEFVESALFAVTLDEEWPNELIQPKKIVQLDRALFRDLDIFGTHSPILVCPLPPITNWVPAAPAGLELVLALQDPANLGACLRSAEAFGVRQVVLLKECAFAFHPKTIRASSGSSLRLQLTSGASLKEFSDDATWALDMNGDSLGGVDWPSDTRLLIGEEGQGLPPTFSGRRLSIPISTGMDSLNAAVAASIALFSYRRQFPL